MSDEPQYTVRIRPRARKQMDALDRRFQRRVVAALQGLAIEPRPLGCKPLTGLNNYWRVRVGDYRVVYTVDDDGHLVVVVLVGPRGSVYKDLFRKHV